MTQINKNPIYYPQNRVYNLSNYTAKINKQTSGNSIKKNKKQKKLQKPGHRVRTSE